MVPSKWNYSPARKVRYKAIWFNNIQGPTTSPLGIVVMSLICNYFHSLNSILQILIPCTTHHVLSPPGEDNPIIGIIRRFCGDDPHLWDFWSDRFPNLCLIMVWLTPSFCWNFWSLYLLVWEAESWIESP